MACETQQVEALSASDVYAYAPLTATVPGVAYFTLTNQGSTALTVREYSSDCFEQAELHSSVMDDGVMEMRPVKMLRIEPASSVTLRPGGLHLMLINASAAIKPGNNCRIAVLYGADKRLDFEVTLLDRSTYRPAEPVM
ncbi:MAG: copper chaperone PCu(A)C [Woeseia sp.]|nr:copper chaperone PCu(A)C [Woeseia sp.]MBT8095543.1 copper chaperone PCu(A)C [Woeseia sp.]NNE59849.1 copper chaperone PCu(A)C [Woeseia sp.]NNL55868.1 copper chaperone PCu(A)C [Woeseia sp.]